MDTAKIADDWSRLAKHFTEDASYDSGEGSEAASGLDAVLQKFQDAVNALDRAIGQREVQLHSVSSDGDKVVAQWTARYKDSGLPALEINGTEFARFDGDAIGELRQAYVRPFISSVCTHDLRERTVKPINC